MVETIKYKRIWAAVLQQAIKDLQLLKGSHGYNYGDGVKQSAIDWMVNDKDEYIGSFPWVCKILDYDPEYIRTLINSPDL